jgi:UDP-glucose 4-epimerase
MKKKVILVTGCAGFIGSNLVDRLLSSGINVVGVDNFSTGQRRFIVNSLNNSNFRFFESDLQDLDILKNAFKGCDEVIHLSANADVRFGTLHPRRDLEQNTIARLPCSRPSIHTVNDIFTKRSWQSLRAI